MGVPLDVAIQTRCPLCGARAGKPCLTVTRRVQVERRLLHQERIIAAGRARA